MILMILVITTVGCSSSAVKPLISATDEDSLITVPIDWKSYEDFDLDPYQESSEASSNNSFHDMPDQLLRNDLEFDDVYKERQGFRIQILATLDKQEADLAYEDALTWWEGLKNNSSLSEEYMHLGEEPLVYLDFHPPYYRLRIGNFIDRDDARELLDMIRREYEGSFIAPGVILVK